MTKTQVQALHSDKPISDTTHLDGKTHVVYNLTTGDFKDGGGGNVFDSTGLVELYYLTTASSDFDGQFGTYTLVDINVIDQETNIKTVNSNQTELKEDYVPETKSYKTYSRGELENDPRAPSKDPADYNE